MNVLEFKNHLITSSEYHRREKVILEKYPDYYIEINSLIFSSFSEKLYHYVFNLTIPICPICQNTQTKFINFVKGYSNVCSEKCSGRYYLQKRSAGRLKSNLEKYGVENVSQLEEVKNKIKKTNLERYGVENVFQAKEIKEKSIKTLRDRNIDDVLEMDKKNVEFTNVSQLASYKEKFLKTMTKKYGDNITNPFQVESIKEKIYQTTFKKYGVKHILQSKEFRIKQAKNNKITSLEKKVIEILTNNNITFEHQYYINKDGIIHTFDFAIFNKTDLICLLDTDGVYYHGYLSDQDGKKVNTDYDFIRTIIIPENVKFISIIESDFENGIKELFNVLNLNYDKYIEDIYNWCRSMNFPYPNYAIDVLKKSYNQLQVYDKFYLKSQIGFNIIRHFHKSIYFAKIKNKLSPYDAWFNDEMLLKVIKNRVIYKNNIDPSRVLEGFNITKIAPKVSVFKPTVAKSLILKYLNQYNEIFDPFSGFSGRMLATASLLKKYIGQDLNENHIKESKEIVDFLKLDNIDLSIKDSIISTGEYECLFTCPPYSDKENWKSNNTPIKICDEWIDVCLNNFKCKSYLFVVDNTEKYKEFIVEILENKSHFGKNNEFVILING
jgi:hypothetical protein